MGPKKRGDRIILETDSEDSFFEDRPKKESANAMIQTDINF